MSITYFCNFNSFCSKIEKFKGNDLQSLVDEFPNVEGVGNDRYVFNVKRNEYRIILKLFLYQIAYVRFVGNHKEYDQIKNIKEI